MLAMLVTTTLVILGVTSLPTYAAAPTLKLAINAAAATAGNKVVTLEIKRPTWSGYQTKGGTTIQMRDKVGISMSLGTHKNEAYISATEP